MQAAVIERPQSIRLVEQEYPDINENEVLVRVRSVGLCGSDIGLFQGKYGGPHSYPIIFGHEWSGEIVETGGNVVDFKKNERITGDCSLWCGSCQFCRENKNLCRKVQKFGITKDGACREFFSIDQKYIYKASKNLPFEIISLAEPISVSLNALSRVKGPNMKTALVIGAGTIGLSAVYFLKNYYMFEKVDIYDFIENRLKIALNLGAANIIQVNKKLSDEYDLIVVAAGSNEALNMALHLAKPGGNILCIGHLKNEPAHLDLIIGKALHIIGSIGGTGQFETTLDLLEGHHQKLKDIVTHKIDLNSVETAFQIAQNQEEAVKVVINLD